MKTEYFNIFNEKQLEAIKLIIDKGMWGNADIEFSIDENTNEGFGYYTNMNKGKQWSGLLSGISKTISASKTNAFKHCSDWWGDGSGDMLFFNMDLLECTWLELDEWACK